MKCHAEPLDATEAKLVAAYEEAMHEGEKNKFAIAIARHQAKRGKPRRKRTGDSIDAWYEKQNAACRQRKAIRKASRA